MSEELRRKLVEAFCDREYRQFYVKHHTRQFIAEQIRQLREARGWTQAELGERAGGMKQSRISELESLDYSGYTINTLRRLYDAFDVALVALGIPYDKFINQVAVISPNNFRPAGFEEQLSYLCGDFLDTSMDDSKIDHDIYDVQDLEAMRIPDDDVVPGQVSARIIGTTVTPTFQEAAMLADFQQPDAYQHG